MTCEKRTDKPREHRKYFSLSLVIVCLLCSSVWLVQRSLHPHLPQVGETPKLYSNQTQDDLRLLFLEAISKAQETLHLVMFGLNDASILAALKKGIDQKVLTTIYYDRNGSEDLRGKLPGCRLVPVRQGGLMHQKILILDGDLIFIGSANMTSSSLRMHDNLVVGFRSRSVARFLLDRMPTTSGSIRSMVGGQDLELWLLPDARGHVLGELRHHLRNAAKSIRIALFTFTHPGLVEELILAKARNVEVTLVVDRRSGLGASAKAVQRLRAAGIRVSFNQGTQLLHHKFVWIDEQTLISGSANWTKAAFYKNSDCILVLHQMTEDQRSTMKKLWRRIDRESKVAYHADDAVNRLFTLSPDGSPRKHSLLHQFSQGDRSSKSSHDHCAGTPDRSRHHHRLQFCWGRIDAISSCNGRHHPNLWRDHPFPPLLTHDFPPTQRSQRCSPA